jgi:hypothetical protein
MNSVKVNSNRHSSIVSWNHDHGTVEKRYSGRVEVLPLADGQRVLILEPFGASADNAVIFNCDGSVLVRLTNPLADRGALGFSAAGYEGAELALIARLRGLEVMCFFDEDGHLLRVAEIR